MLRQKTSSLIRRAMLLSLIWSAVLREAGLMKGGAMEDDLQGLENIMDYIFNDNYVLCPPPLGSGDKFNDRIGEE
jgi:hypothetical protein